MYRYIYTLYIIHIHIHVQCTIGDAGLGPLEPLDQGRIVDHFYSERLIDPAAADGDTWRSARGAASRRAHVATRTLHSVQVEALDGRTHWYV